MQPQDSIEFLTPDQVESLLDLTPLSASEPQFKGTYIDNLYQSQNRQPYTMPRAQWAICPELLEALTESVMLEVAGDTGAGVYTSVAQPWAPRNTAAVPTLVTVPSVIIDVVVPTGCQWWIDGYAFNIFPSLVQEMNLQWQLLINGQDFLNRGNTGVPPGRPVQSPEKVIIASERANMILAKEGTSVQVIVSCITNNGSADTLSATVFGFLEAVPSGGS